MVSIPTMPHAEQNIYRLNNNDEINKPVPFNFSEKFILTVFIK